MNEISTWLRSIWDWISAPTNLGIIGSLASIIGLPVALVQLRDVKTKVQASQDAVNKMIDSLKYEKLATILQKLKKAQDQYVRIKGKIGERGQNEKSIRVSIDSIIVDLTHCDQDLPIGFDAVENSIRETIQKLEALKESKEKNNELREAETSFRTTISVMKSEIDKGNKNKLSASTK